VSSLEVEEVKEKIRIYHRGRRGSTEGTERRGAERRVERRDAEDAEKREMVTAIWVGLKCCHGPSAAWPAHPFGYAQGRPKSGAQENAGHSGRDDSVRKRRKKEREGLNAELAEETPFGFAQGRQRTQRRGETERSPFAGFAQGKKRWEWNWREAGRCSAK